MTDEENKRQRHLAEMMLAECDGKQMFAITPNCSTSQWQESNTPPKKQSNSARCWECSKDVRYE